MKTLAAALTILLSLPGASLAADTATDLYSQCMGGDPSLALASAAAAAGSVATLAAMATENCREMIVRSWESASVRGQLLCPSPDEEVTDLQLASIFLDWVRRHPRYLRAPPNEALYAAWENSFPCRRH